VANVAESPTNIIAAATRRAKDTWAGSLLVRLAAMTVLLTAFVVAVAQLQESLAPFLEKLGFSDAVQTYLVFGLPAVFVVVWLTQEGLSSLRARRLRLTEYEPPRAGYFRIEPYGIADPAYSRPDGAHEATVEWVLSSEAPVLYLSGQSGCGKSSLVSAWLLPELERRDWVVCSVRSYADPLAAAAAALAKPGVLWRRPPDWDDPAEFLRHARAGSH